jgi:hypothetical protein
LTIDGVIINLPSGSKTVSYPCKDNSLLSCSSLTYNSKEIRVLLNNGLSVVISLKYVTFNQSQKISWLTSLVALDNRHYAGKVYGLMGNYNGISNDDLVSRNNGKAPRSMVERDLYDVAITCK